MSVPASSRLSPPAKRPEEFKLLVRQESSLRDDERTEDPGGLWEIIIAVLLISIPLVAISVALLVVVFAYRIRETPSNFGQLGKTNLGSGAYLVNINSTKIALIASFASDVAPLLAAAILTLLSYPISKKLYKWSIGNQENDLPSPREYGYIITLLAGQTGTLWSWLKENLKGARWFTRLLRMTPVEIGVWGLIVGHILTYSIVVLL